MENARSGWHGFRNLVDFVKATASLGGMLTLGLWAILTLALDGRYAPSAIAAQVADAQQVAAEVKEQVETVQNSVVTLQTSLIEQQIFDVRIRGCEATTPEQRRFFAQRQIDLENQFFSLNGRRPSVPACDSVQ